MKYFDLKNISIDLLAAMYEPTHPGYVLIPAGITEAGRKEIIKEILTKIRGDFQAAPGYEGSVWQNFVSLQFGRADNQGKSEYKFNPDLLEGKLPILEECIREYTTSIYNPLAEMAKFGKEEDLVNSIGIHRYPKGAGGIGYHQDYFDNINLITAITLTGEAKFLVAQGFKKENSKIEEILGQVEERMGEGDILFMRGHRRKSEAARRPLHMVKCTQERYALLLRTICPKEMIPL